jgi:sigma-E factor negative regulatory protein RseB
MQPVGSHRRTRECRRFYGVMTVAMLGCSIAVVSYAADETDANAWLERMARALATRNYDGRFSHFSNGRAESMRIVHRVHDGVVTERLVSLDGSGREVIRTDSEVMCYLPDRRTVLVEKRTGSDSLLTTIPSYNDRLKANYVLSSPMSGRVMGRIARLVTVAPRDEFRYGYRLWLDNETAMPLKSELCDAQGRAIEQIVFADLQLPATIPDAALEPAMSTAGFQWVRQDHRPLPLQGNSAWTVLNPPRGFRLTITRIQTIAGSQAPVRHMVFSDGLASVSVFIEPSNTNQVEPSGLARVGAAYAFSTEVANHRVTAVGEVPANTVRAIANGVARKDDSPKRKAGRAPAPQPQ